MGTWVSWLLLVQEGLEAKREGSPGIEVVLFDFISAGRAMFVCDWLETPGPTTLPLPMSSPTTLALKIDEIWSDVLVITELELQAMSTKPLKWLRHVAWCLYGTLGALHTIVDENLEPIFDEELVSGFASQYCYVPESDGQ